MTNRFDPPTSVTLRRGLMRRGQRERHDEEQCRDPEGNLDRKHREHQVGAGAARP